MNRPLLDCLYGILRPQPPTFMQRRRPPVSCCELRDNASNLVILLTSR